MDGRRYGPAFGRGGAPGTPGVTGMNELRRIRGLLEVYETALEELRRLDDPALEEFAARLEARSAAAAHDYFEALRDAGSISGGTSWPLDRRFRSSHVTAQAPRAGPSPAAGT